MAHPRLKLVTHILRHAMGVLLLCWLRAIRAGAIAGAAGILVTEIGAVLVTHHFPPDGLAQLSAVALGAALAFGVAATVIADELIVGIIDTIRLLLGEAEAGARAARVMAQREAGEASGRLLDLFGLGGLALPIAARVPGAAAAHPPAPFPWRPDAEPTSETLAGLAGYGTEGPDTQPLGEPAATPPVGQPVPAAQLPRINWANEPAPADLPTANDYTGVPPATSALAAEAVPMTRLADQGHPPIAPASVAALGAGLAEPLVWHADDTPPATDTWHDPLRAIEPEPAEEAIVPVDLFGGPPPSPTTRPLDSTTRPLPEKTRPLSQSEPLGVARSSVWDHISQVLAGRPVPPLPPESSEPDAEVPAPDDHSTPRAGD